MILVTDVAYDDRNGKALAAGVLIETWQAEVPLAEYTVPVDGVAPYESGEFYKRELPCLLALIAMTRGDVRTVVVDGYVDVGPKRPGLGRHLYEALHRKASVVGVAKSSFHGSPAAQLMRGRSQKALYVTAVGLPLVTAVDAVATMAGSYRIPTMLQRVDALSRETAWRRSG